MRSGLGPFVVEGSPAEDGYERNQQLRMHTPGEGPRFMDASTPMMHDGSSETLLVLPHPVIRKGGDALNEGSEDGAGFTTEPPQLLRRKPSTDALDLSGQLELGGDERNAPLWKDHLCQLMYERSQERKAIMSAYRQMLANATSTVHADPDVLLPVAAQSQQEFLVISGPAGCGKTTLAKTLAPTVVQDGGFFLMGKFDQLERQEPFHAFVSAFSQYVRHVLKAEQQQQQQQARLPNESIKERVRNAIYEAVGSEVGVLTSFIPALAHIVGTDVSPLPQERENAGCRFIYCMRLFVRAICSPQNPIVLVLDDLQHASDGSLKLLRCLITDHDIRGLIVIGTSLCTVSSKSALSVFLRGLEDESKARIRNINLSIRPDITALLAETFALPAADCQSLSEIICEQTHGNMLYMVEFVRYLADEGLLKFRQGRWTWDINDIRKLLQSKQLGDFVNDKLVTLPLEVQDTLRVASCLGCTVDKLLLDLLFEKDQALTLEIASQRGILALQVETAEYRFTTDIIQDATYNLIPPVDREHFHAELGRLLLKKLDKQLVEEKLFTILRQFQIGSKHIVEETERQAIAMICLHGGKMAARSSAFQTASDYLDFGMSLLPAGDDKWNPTNKDLSLAMLNASAEVQACLADTERLDALLSQLISCQKLTPCDKLVAYCTKMYSLGQRNRQEEAVDMGIAVLKVMGETFPSKLCNARLMNEARGVFRLLKGKSDSEILSMQRIADQKLLMVMRILNIISLDTICARPKMTPFVILKMMSITLRHGLSEHASSAFALFGLLILNIKFDVDMAYRYGQVAMALLDMYKLDEYLPRVYAAFYGIIVSWKEPVRVTFAPLCRSHKTGLRTGDLEFAALAGNIALCQKIHGGPPLRQLQESATYMVEWMKSHKQFAGLKFAKANLMFFQLLLGDLNYSSSGDGGYAKILHELVDNGVAINVNGAKTYMMIIHYKFGNFKEAESCFVKDQEGEPRDFGVSAQWLYESMTRLAFARQGIKKRKNLRKVRAVIKQLKALSTKCPENLSDKVFLLQGELASVNGNYDRALSKFKLAATMAAASKFLCFEALAYERMGWLVARQPLPDLAVARSYFEQSCARYQEWEAFAKVDHLREEFSSVL